MGSNALAAFPLRWPPRAARLSSLRYVLPHRTSVHVLRFEVAASCARSEACQAAFGATPFRPLHIGPPVGFGSLGSEQPNGRRGLRGNLWARQRRIRSLYSAVIPAPSRPSRSGAFHSQYRPNPALKRNAYSVTRRPSGAVPPGPFCARWLACHAVGVRLALR